MSAVTSIVWAKYCAPKKLSAVLRLNEDIVRWYDGMQRDVPQWYIAGFSD